jgi:hypothetical protein
MKTPQEYTEQIARLESCSAAYEIIYKMLSEGKSVFEVMSYCTLMINAIINQLKILDDEITKQLEETGLKQ